MRIGRKPWLECGSTAGRGDWHSLRVGGLICAGTLCALGIIILLSGKCKCKFSQKSSHRPGDAPPLITPGSAHDC
ncbi:FXYD domain-containing ion transport regulator 3 isoform X2 [Sus scrofa]|uniref:FXYD domain-containing ion transport regulator 3 isoform X2 n=1 Tax=Sus scrofa TaxID=9823 RepID=UPI000A2B83D4|nr:FXYD domain-containing ion transport regulator 3 isoform X2 [Sus scrofa]